MRSVVSWAAGVCVVAILACQADATLHHACSQPAEGSSIKEADQCTACYMETLMSAQMTKSGGSDMVIGANDGISFDPAWFFGYWSKVPQHTITWVEPNPTLFKRLSQNTEAIPNKVLLNRAVRPLTMTDSELSLWCWNLTMVEQVLAGTMARPWNAVLGEVKPHWTALCSMSLPSIVEASDIAKSPEFHALPPSEQRELIADIESKWFIKHTVPARLPGELVAEAGITDLRYLQIDVEGLDNEIVKSLPLGTPNFSPELIMFENHQGFAVKPFLEENGYYVCCCLRKWGSNIVAVKINSSLPDLL